MTFYYVVTKVTGSHVAYGSTFSGYGQTPTLKLMVQAMKTGNVTTPPAVLKTLTAAGTPTKSYSGLWTWDAPNFTFTLGTGASCEVEFCYNSGPVAAKRIYESQLRSMPLNKTVTLTWKLHDYTIIDANSGDLTFEITRTDSLASAATTTAYTATNLTKANSGTSRALLMKMLKRADSDVAATSSTTSSVDSTSISVASSSSSLTASASSSSLSVSAAAAPSVSSSAPSGDSSSSATASIPLPPGVSADSAPPSTALFKLSSFQTVDAAAASNPWAVNTPKLQPTATAPSNSLATISRTSTIVVKDKKKTVDEKLPPKLKTMDLPLGLSQLQLLRVATSAFGAIAIAEDGSLLYWTHDSHNDKFVEGGPVPGFAGSVIIDIAAGHDHFLALTMDGFLYAWGANQYHQCSAEPIPRIHTPVKVSSKLIFACAAGGHSSMCIDTHGVVFTWGRASTSLTVPVTSPFAKESSNTSQSSNASQAPSNPTNAALSSEVRPSTAVTHRTIIVDSLSHGGEMAATRSDSRYVSELTSIWLPEDLSFTQASMSSTMSVLVARDGSVWAWGDANATCGSSADSISLTPVRVPFPKGVRIVRALAGDIHALALDSTGKLWSWGNRFVGGQLSLDAPTSAAPIPVVFNGSSKDSEGSAQEVVIDFGISENESCAITSSSDVYVWKNYESCEKVETIGDNAPVGVSHGPSCTSTYFVLGSVGGTKTAFGYGQRASQIYSMEDDDTFEPEFVEDDGGVTTDSAAE